MNPAQFLLFMKMLNALRLEIRFQHGSSLTPERMASEVIEQAQKDKENNHKEWPYNEWT